MERRLAAILAADVVGYSRLMELDEAGTLDALKAHRAELIDPAIAEHRGRIVKHTGDGFVAEFPSVQDAVRCVIDMQLELAANPLDFRMGVNLGDVVEASHNPWSYPDINCHLRTPDGGTVSIRTKLLIRDPNGFYANHGAVAGEEHHRLPDAPTHAKVRELSGGDYTAAAAAAFGGYAETLGNISYPVRQGSEIGAEPENSAPVTLTKLEGLKLIRLIAGLDKLSTLEAQLIEKRLGDAPWDKEAVEKLAREMKAGADPGDVEPLAGVVG